MALLRCLSNFLSLHACQVKDQGPGARDRGPGTRPCSSPQHGALGQGALPQLHDRLNHGAADVAAGENLPGLKAAG